MRPDAASPLLLVVLVGIPGSGKSTLARALISGAPPTDRTWSRISQDVLGSRNRCLKAARRAVREGQHVVVDRCNFDETQRAHWFGLGAPDEPTPFDHHLAIYLPVPPDEAEQRVLARGTHEGGVDVQSMSEAKIASIVQRMQGDLRLPALSEGFGEVLHLERGRAGMEAVLARVWALSSGEVEDDAEPTGSGES